MGSDQLQLAMYPKEDRLVLFLRKIVLWFNRAGVLWLYLCVE